MVVCPIMAAGEPNSNCGCTGASGAPSSGKLVHCEDIMKGFEGGKERVSVIVNLAEPAATKAKTNWNSKQSLKRLQDEIEAGRAPVLASLSENEFKPQYRFDNQAGFSGEVTLAGLEKLKNDPRVVSIEPVYLLEPHLRQGIALMHADTYRSVFNGDGVAIAICDTGIDYTHPMLGNGGFPNSKVIGGYDYGDNDADPMPDSSQGHGTCCAGIAAGDLGNTGDYIGGVAYNAKLYAVKMTSGTSGSATSAAMVAAWNWCVTHKNDDPCHPILVISTSFGGSPQSSLCDSYYSSMTQAANNAVAAGITVLASSGNDGVCNSIAWPACISSVMSVGAVYDAAFGTYYPCISSSSCATKYSTTGCTTGWYAIDSTFADMVTSYSNTASFLTILAPSNQCYTTDIVGSGGYNSSGDYYSAFGGTSAACPYAAGAAACLQSAAKAIRGSYLSPAEVKTTLTSNGDSVADGKAAITKPRVNLQKAIGNLDANEVTVEYSVSASNDDAYASSSTTQIATNIYLQIGRLNTSAPYYMSGMRFTNIAIPSFSQIVSANLKICSYSSNLTSTVYGQIQGEAADNSPDFSAPLYLGNIAKTTASVDWVLSAAWTANTWYISPDISAVVQEVIDRSGWSAGNALAIIYSTQTSSSKNRYRNFYSFDYGTHSYAPKLAITYIRPAILTTSSTIGGSVTTPGQGTFNCKRGTAVNLTATPTANYHFVNWTGSGVVAGKVANPNSAATTITMDGDYAVAANFAIDQYVIGGTVTFNSTGLDGVTLGGLPGTPITSGGGLYGASVDYGWSGTVTPVKTGYHFTPALKTYSTVGEHHTADNYTAALNTYTISGHIKNRCNVSLSGVSVDANNSGGHTITDANGYYEIGVNYGWTGAVTPAKNEYTFEPNNLSYAGVAGAIADQNYVATNIYDLDGDCSIGMGDLAILLQNWLADGADIAGNFNHDAILDFLDYAVFARHWLEGVGP